MKMIFSGLFASFVCVVAASASASVNVKDEPNYSKVQPEPLSCTPNGGSCVGENNCCSGICESCGAAWLFCRAKSCESTNSISQHAGEDRNPPKPSESDNKVKSLECRSVCASYDSNGNCTEWRTVCD